MFALHSLNRSLAVHFVEVLVHFGFCCTRRSYHVISGTQGEAKTLLMKQILQLSSRAIVGSIFQGETADCLRAKSVTK